jgi:L-threonylcarbamoyladenylate synthase
VHRGIAVRVSEHPVVIGLCQAYGGALVSTSANLSGKPAVSDRDALDPLLLPRVDAVVAGHTGGLARPTVIRDALTGQSLRE